ncbi:MAG TPA: hypothetical protein VF414_17855 [Thermoanaerobaculia bacterium]
MSERERISEAVDALSELLDPEDINLADVVESVRRVDRAKEALRRKLGREPTDYEIELKLRRMP